MGGQIICIAGAPRTGKSHLVRKLAAHFSGVGFYEGEESDFPERIKEDITRRIRPLERALWFRNRLVEQYRQALEVKRRGDVAVTDIAYFAVELYVDVLTDDQFEREVLHDLARSDIALLGMPDVVVLLVSSEATTRDFVARGGRAFDANPSYYTEYILPIEHAWREYLKANAGTARVVTIDRSLLDFDKEEDFQKVLAQLPT